MLIISQFYTCVVHYTKSYLESYKNLKVIIFWRVMVTAGCRVLCRSIIKLIKYWTIFGEGGVQHPPGYTTVYMYIYILCAPYIYTVWLISNTKQQIVGNATNRKIVGVSISENAPLVVLDYMHNVSLRVVKKWIEFFGWKVTSKQVSCMRLNIIKPQNFEICYYILIKSF